MSNKKRLELLRDFGIIWIFCNLFWAFLSNTSQGTASFVYASIAVPYIWGCAYLTEKTYMFFKGDKKEANHDLD